MLEAAGKEQGVSIFDDLGVYRIFADVRELSGVERFVRDWLGALLDYDAERGSDLVETLSRYLELGGSYDATAGAVSVHRSTLKYRLQRIREISGYDIHEPDVHFHLELATRALRTLRTLNDDAGAPGQVSSPRS
jgi:DNA-binding PucR family transcriptional regulator